MTSVERLLADAAMDGLTVTLTPSGQLELEGAPDCVAFWRVFITEYREQVIEALQ